MASICWDRKGILLVDFIPKGTTIIAAEYRETLKKLKKIKDKRSGTITRGVLGLTELFERRGCHGDCKKVASRGGAEDIRRGYTKAGDQTSKVH
ncbi:hypothetical protein J437_LFUL015025 [Ladona fulva]|uniref:Uncharacterized protein n=1 Tax=Ladona fulva TaxID=123851 RepID=A0A8K0KHH0_LADFU|nr:hypothetical protein J437_LFUL015025 [Ladona fulva]